MLLGGSETDHIFLMDGLEAHLDELHSVGANYVRNTMSQREEIELKPHRLLPDGTFDIDQWNEDYWTRFENMLKWTADREIFVQIEVWDRFDFSTTHWEISPWNPANNVNYNFEQTVFDVEYPEHPARDKQPFFHSIPGMRQYDEKLDLIRSHQVAFVDKMLSYSLDYGHVLYCMNNETSTPPPWGQFWIEHIQAKAAEKDVLVYVTDMFDDAFRGQEAEHIPTAFADPGHYMFADVSQVNSRLYDRTHWETLRWLIEQVNVHPRPTNHVKIYGSGYHRFGTGGPEDGVERFWRNILGGSAAARFHRPDAGNGLNDWAKCAIKAARLLEGQIPFWTMTPCMDLLTCRSENDAYAVQSPKGYAIYFTCGGSVDVDLSGGSDLFELSWISVSMGLTTETAQGGGYKPMEKNVEGGGVVSLAAPYKGGWIAVLAK